MGYRKLKKIWTKLCSIEWKGVEKIEEVDQSQEIRIKKILVDLAKEARMSLVMKILLTLHLASTKIVLRQLFRGINQIQEFIQTMGGMEKQTHLNSLSSL